MDLETTAPRIGNRSDALELLDTLLDMIKDNHSKQFLIVWYALKTLKLAVSIVLPTRILHNFSPFLVSRR
jgi:hypothetical protein